MSQHDALVVAVHPSGESALVVDLLCRDAGRMACMARGVRRSRQRFPAGLDVLTRVEVQEEPPRRGELHELVEAVVTESYLGLRSDPLALGRAAYVVELGTALTARGHANPPLYDVVTAALSCLSAMACGAALLRWVEVQLLMAAGELSPPCACVACGNPLDGPALSSVATPGHLYCERCAPPHARPLARDVSSVLSLTARCNARTAANAAVSELTSVATGRWLAPVVAHSVGRPLKSRRFLAQLQHATVSSEGLPVDPQTSRARQTCRPP
jgi:DNA repair protein RecO (recombination protein O)